MKLSVRPALTTAPVVRGLDRDHDRRRGQRCTVLNRPVSLINRGKLVQINRATSQTVDDMKSDQLDNSQSKSCLFSKVILRETSLKFVLYTNPIKS